MTELAPPHAGLGVAKRSSRSLVIGVVLAAAVFAPAASALPTTTRVSVSAAGDQASRGGFGYGSPWMSADGRFLLFMSRSPDLVTGDGADVDLFVRDRRRETTSLVTAGDGFLSGAVSMSITGRYVGYSYWNGEQHVAYVRDMRRATSSSLFPLGGRQPLWNSQSASISRDGRYVAFVAYRSSRTSRFDVFVRDRRRSVTRLISRGRGGRPANGSSGYVAVSANGRYIAFSSYASNLVRPDANRRHDVFVYDRARRKIIWTTARAEIGPFGRHPPRALAPAISASGRYVAFTSTYRHLVEGDTNNQYDIFVHDLGTGTTQRVSLASGGRQVCVPPPKRWQRPCHGEFALSPDGRFVAFSSIAPDLVPGDDNQVRDLFVYDTRTQTTIRASVSASGGEICGPFTDDCIGGAAISAGGRFVGFNSTDATVVDDDTNRDVDVFVRGPLR